MGPCTVVGYSLISGVSNSGVSKKGSPGGEGRQAVSVGENDSGGDLDGDSSNGSLSGSVPCITRKRQNIGDGGGVHGRLGAGGPEGLQGHRPCTQLFDWVAAWPCRCADVREPQRKTHARSCAFHAGPYISRNGGGIFPCCVSRREGTGGATGRMVLRKET